MTHWKKNLVYKISTQLLCGKMNHENIVQVQATLWAQVCSKMTLKSRLQVTIRKEGGHYVFTKKPSLDSFIKCLKEITSNPNPAIDKLQTTEEATTSPYNQLGKTKQSVFRNFFKTPPNKEQKTNFSEKQVSMKSTKLLRINVEDGNYIENLQLQRGSSLFMEENKEICVVDGNSTVIWYDFDLCQTKKKTLLGVTHIYHSGDKYFVIKDNGIGILNNCFIEITSFKIFPYDPIGVLTIENDVYILIRSGLIKISFNNLTSPQLKMQNKKFFFEFQSNLIDFTHVDSNNMKAIYMLDSNKQIIKYDVVSERNIPLSFDDQGIGGEPTAIFASDKYNGQYSEIAISEKGENGNRISIFIDLNKNLPTLQYCAGINLNNETPVKISKRENAFFVIAESNCGTIESSLNDSLADFNFDALFVYRVS